MPLENVQTTNKPLSVQERDRFVAFAFAAADLLFELDDNDNIQYLNGASEGFLGARSSKYLKKSFLDLFADDKKDEVKKLLSESRKIGRKNNFADELCPTGSE